MARCWGRMLPRSRPGVAGLHVQGSSPAALEFISYVLVLN